MTHGITDALLIYNPTSGRRRSRRFAEIEQSVRILKEAGIKVELAPTEAPWSRERTRAPRGQTKPRHGDRLRR